MKDIPDKSVDMILCDLPYGTTACKWDIVIPFVPMWEQLNRVIKDNGAIALFGSEPFSSALRMSNIEMYKYDWVWNKEKSSSPLNCNYQPLKTHELISVFSKMSSTYSKNGNMKYYPQGLISYEKKTNRKEIKDGIFHSYKTKTTEQKYTNYPKSIVCFNKDYKQHPTQKPVALLEYLVKTYTKENETILDFTMGSGSTGVACINTNRNFIGIEKDDKYFEIAKERTQEALKVSINKE